MDWVWDESFWPVCPGFADELVWCEAFEWFESAGEIINCDEVVEVLPELFVVVVVVAFNGGFLDGSVHPLDLAVGPGMFHLGQPVLDVIFVADPVEDMVKGVFVPLLVGELDAVVGENRVNFVGYCDDQVPQELGGDHLSGFVV